MNHATDVGRIHIPAEIDSLIDRAVELTALQSSLLAPTMVGVEDEVSHEVQTLAETDIGSLVDAYTSCNQAKPWRARVPHRAEWD